MINSQEDTLLSVSDAARFLGVSESTIRRWDRAGKLKSLRTPGGHRRFHKEDLKVFYVDRNKVGIIFS